MLKYVHQFYWKLVAENVQQETLMLYPDLTLSYAVRGLGLRSQLFYKGQPLSVKTISQHVSPNFYYL